MLGKDEISRLFDIQNVERSSKMETALHLYKDMRTNVPSWCDENTKTVRFSNTICREIANLTCFNISVQVSDPYLQNKVDEVMNIIQYKQEECAATCGLIVKSSGDGIDFLPPERFLITDSDSNGVVRGFVGFDWKKEQDIYYVKAEYNRYETDENGQIRQKISAKAYKTRDLNTIGETVKLGAVSEWKDIQPEVTIDGLDAPLFIYWRTPFANSIDPDSPLCLPIFADAIEEIKDFDIAYSRNAGEIADSQRIILADDRLMMPTGTPVNAGRGIFSKLVRAVGAVQLPHFVKNVFGGSPQEFYQEINPTLNTEVRKVGINQQLQIIGYKCGFSNGYFSFDSSRGIQTATQVEADDRRTLQTVEAFRNILDGKNHDGVLHRIVYILYIIAVSNGEMTPTNYTVQCNFLDLVRNYEDDKNRAYQLMVQNIIPKWYYLMKWEGYSENEAKALVEEAQGAAQQGGLFGEE